METKQVYFKLREILREKYTRSFVLYFSAYEIDKNKDLETQWSLYLNSIGCQRTIDYSENSIECPDSYHRAYKIHYIIVPKELALKILTLGTLP
jgi:hypothetical protein